MPQQKFNKLAGARILVLGGTSGIGFSVAEGGLEYGASVVVASSNPAKVEKAISRLRDAYPDHAARISGQACDLYTLATMEANLTALLQFATKDGKKIDHLVNTAGGPGPSPPLAEITAEQATDTAPKLAALMMLGKLAPLYMEPGPQSSITITTGTLAYKPLKGQTTALAWLGAVDSVTRSFAVALAPLRVNAIAPGAIDTELLQGFFGDDASVKEASLKMFRDTNLLGTLGRPEDTAEAYLYLMKDRFVTGQSLVTDGGRLLK